MSTMLESLDGAMKLDYKITGLYVNEVIILHFNRDADISGETVKEKIGESLEQMLTNLCMGP